MANLGSHLPILGPQNTEGRGSSSLGEGEVRVPALRKKRLHLSETKLRALTCKMSGEKAPGILLMKEKCKRKEHGPTPNILELGKRRLGLAVS